MATTNQTKLKHLYTTVPPGSPVTSARLADIGISADLAVHYARAGWLQRLARGVYKRPDEPLQLLPSLVVLQQQIAGLHVGGKTALEWYGIRQYVSHAARAVFVRLGSRRLPEWFTKHFPSEYHRQRLFTEKPKQMLAVQRFENRDNAPLVSIPERALLELLDDVGVRQPLQEAKGNHGRRAHHASRRVSKASKALHKRQDRAVVPNAGARTFVALGRKTQPGNLAHGKCPALDLEVARRLAGAQALNQIYLDTARLLIQVAPLVFADNIFALKGGTAINLFVRDMPRLSVDLDLVFTDHTIERTEALNTINQAIKSMVGRLKRRGFQTHTATAADAGETKLFVRRGKLEVKVEVNFVLRGTVHPIRAASLSAKAKKALQADLELPVVSLADLYGGKLVAALDRQHPRDLFDVMELFNHEGITRASVAPSSSILLLTTARSTKCYFQRYETYQRITRERSKE